MAGPIATTNGGSGGYAQLTPGKKRAYQDDSSSSTAHSSTKKQKVTHRIRHQQPLHHIADPINVEGVTYLVTPDSHEGDVEHLTQSKGFFQDQLLRAIAIQCKGVGFDGLNKLALEAFRGMVEQCMYMLKFLSDVQTSMASARRTSTVSRDWINALLHNGVTSPSILEAQFDTGDIPAAALQPPFEPPPPELPRPQDVEPILGPELSGRLEKENRPWIPAHLPPFPSKHTWTSTPDYPKREYDPRKIREKATEEGIHAETALRKLMAAQKKGAQTTSQQAARTTLNKNASKRGRESSRFKKSDALWMETMKEVMTWETDRVEAAREQEDLRKVREHEQREIDRQYELSMMNGMGGEGDFELEASPEPVVGPKRKTKEEIRAEIEKVDLTERPRVDYGKRFWRKSGM